MDEKVEITYQGSKFPKWLAALWLALLVWFVGYLLYYGIPNFVTWLKEKPIDKFIQ